MTAVQAPHFVLLPGLDGTGKLFAPFLEQFPDPERYTVVRYPGDRTIPYAELHAYILSCVPRDRALILLGESYSGPVAIQLATRADLDVRGLILTATFAHYPARWFARLAGLLPLSLLARLPIPDWVLRRYCFESSTSPDLLAQLREVIRDNQPAVLAQRARQGGQVDMTALLAEVKVPCLYLQASRDRMVPPESVSALRARMPQLKVVTIEGPHFLLQTRPRECYAAIQAMFGL